MFFRSRNSPSLARQAPETDIPEPPSAKFSAGQFVNIVPQKGAHYKRAHYLHIHHLHWSEEDDEWLYDGQFMFIEVDPEDNTKNVLAWRWFVHDAPEHRLRSMPGDRWRQS